MTEKTYVKSIVKKIHGNKETKAKYEKELMDQIMAREAAGEKLYDIAGTMGVPATIAKSINATLPAEEKRGVLIRKYAVIAVIVVILAVILYKVNDYVTPDTKPFGTSGLFVQEEVEAKALQVAAYFENDDIEGLKSISTAELQDIFTPENMEDARSNVSDNLGAYEGVHEVVLFETRQFGKLYAFAEVVVDHENARFMYIMSIDQDLKIASIGVQPVSMETETETAQK